MAFVKPVSVPLILGVATAQLMCAYAQAAPELLADETPAATDPARPAEADTSDRIVIVGRNVISNLDEIAGSASVITADQIESGRVANIADALKFQAGLLAQSATGGEATRFSMRGSGIIRGPTAWGTGIQMLYDGLPLTTPEGSPYEYYEALANNSIEVYRGANAFDYAPTTQGGAINYIPHTGYDATPLLLRQEIGSFDYARTQVSSGQVFGPFDYYVSATKFAAEGFRRRNTTYSNKLVANVGFQPIEAVKARFHLVLAEQNTQNASGLTWAQVEADPRRNNTVVGNRNSLGSVLAAGNLQWEIDDSSTLKFGTLYKNFPLRNEGGTFPARWDVKDLSSALRYEREDVLFGRQSETLVALLHSIVLPDSTNRAYRASNNTLAQTAHFEGHDATLLVRNDLEALDGFWLTTGIAAIEQMRGSEITFPIYDKRTERYSNIAPRLGFRYEFDPNTQVFGNISRSVEAPIAHQLPISRNNVYAFNASIKEQVQDTIEFGGRGRLGDLRWDIAVYRARIKGEILTVQTVPATPTTPAQSETSNATSPTIHAGLEVALEGPLLTFTGGELSLRSSLTLNDFHYEGDPVFGKNTLPAVPQEIVQAGLNVDLDTGFYAAVDVESVLGKYPADFANTIYARPYTIFNARLGWAAPDKSWQFFVEGRNLGNEHYAASVASTFNASGVDSAVYSPGVGRSVSFGLARAF